MQISSVENQGLSARQRSLLSYIEEYVDEHAEAPSLFDLKNYLHSRSLATVHKYMRDLESKGYLKRDNGQSAGIRFEITFGAAQGEFLQVPMVGTIVAGYPLEAISEISEYVTISSCGLNASQYHYALRVNGESMRDCHVHNGDIVVVERTEYVKDGDMVVALIDNTEATLKRFYRINDEVVKLQPENRQFKPIFVHTSNLKIQGKVVRVLPSAI